MRCTTGKNGSRDDITNVNQKFTDSQMSRQMYRQTDRKMGHQSGQKSSLHLSTTRLFNFCADYYGCTL